MNLLIGKRIYLIASIFIGSYLSSCSDTKDKWHPIPAKSSVVIEVNVKTLTKKIVLDKWEEFNFTDLFDSFNKDTTKEKSSLDKILKSPGDAGIDLSKNIYLFKSDSLVGVCASIEDESEFQESISPYYSNKNQINSYHFASIDSVFIAWNAKRVVFLFKNQAIINKKEIKEILELEKKNSIFTNAKFTQSLSPSDDISIWMNSTTILPNDSFFPKEILNSYSCAYLNFNAGKINFSVQDFLKPSYHDLFKENTEDNKKGFAITRSPTFISKGTLHVNPEKFMHLLKIDTNTTLNISKENIFESFTGKIQYTLSSINYSEKTFTSYSFDEDFNKIETTKTFKQLSPDFSLWIETKDSIKSKKLLSKIAHLGLINIQDDFYSFDLTNIPCYIFNRGNGIFIINKNSIPQNLNDGEVYPSPISMEFNFDKLSHDLPYDNPYKNFIKYFKSGTLRLDIDSSQNSTLKGEIELSNSQKNSLLTLLKIIKERNKN